MDSNSNTIKKGLYWTNFRFSKSLIIMLRPNNGSKPLRSSILMLESLDLSLTADFRGCIAILNWILSSNPKPLIGWFLKCCPEPIPKIRSFGNNVPFPSPGKSKPTTSKKNNSRKSEVQKSISTPSTEKTTAGNGAILPEKKSGIAKNSKA